MQIPGLLDTEEEYEYTPYLRDTIAILAGDIPQPPKNVTANKPPVYIDLTSEDAPPSQLSSGELRRQERIRRTESRLKEREKPGGPGLQYFPNLETELKYSNYVRDLQS